MGTGQELERTIEAQLAEGGYDAATLEQRPGSTIVPRRVRPDSAGGRAVEALSAVDREARLARRLDLHETLGEGGMGIVRLGTQRALGRPVAVKTLKAGHQSESATLKLLREAWITGRLEHPNVVPVYDLAIEPDGSPLVVLKKIEGTGWDELMHEPDELRERLDVHDALDWNLRIFMQVCNAVAFAHSRGILHRDLKPENVMIGEFGEVYLVDWGLAVSLTADDDGRFPLAKDATQMAGTLLYMAPEMLGGRGVSLSTRTDVYLLGAILYEIVHGRAPHVGTALMELVLQVVESNPEIDEAAPVELTRLIRGAMRPRPEERIESVDALRLGVQEFLRHRDAAELSARADGLTDALTDRIASLTDEEMPAEREPIYRMFGECRFGYRHALEVWPESPTAQGGLEQAIEAMVRFELRFGEPSAAQALLTEAKDPSSDLVEEVTAAVEARRAEDESLRAVRDEHDRSVGRATRMWGAIGLGTLWCFSALLPDAMVYLGWIDAVTHAVALTFEVIFIVLLIVLGYVTRETTMRTQINRTLGAGATLAFALAALVHVGNMVTDAGDVWVSLRYSFMIWAAVAAVLAAGFEPRLLLPAAAYIIGFFVLGARPRWAYYALSLCNEVLLWSLVWAWLRREDLSLAKRAVEHLRPRAGASGSTAVD